MIARVLEDFHARNSTIDALIRDRALAGPTKTFCTYLPEHRSITYSAFEEQTYRLASALDRHGVPSGSHVAILMDNCIEQLLAIFGVSRSRRVAVPINSAARGQLLRYFITHADCEVAIVEAALYSRIAAIREQLPMLRDVYIVDVPSRPCPLPPDLAATRPFADLIASPSGRREGRGQKSDAHFSDLAMLMFTSGTTGPSKAIMLTQAQVVYWGLDVAFHHEYSADDTAYVFLPLFHGNALLGSTMGTLAAGSSIALALRYSTSRFWADVRSSKATVSNGIGSVAEFLWSEPPSARDRDHTLRRFHIVPVPRYAHEFESRFGLHIMSAFGLTDYCLGTSFNTKSPREKLGSAGLPRRNVDVRVVDADDIDLPPRAPGEILLRNGMPWAASIGYYKAPAQTLESRRNLWFHTGDRGFLDEDGYLWYIDRIKDSIRRRGENISAYEVEEIVRSHPSVLDVAVYPVRSESAEDEVAMSVVLHADKPCKPEDLIQHCVTNLAYFMVPRYVEIVDDLPLTSSMKVEKYKLRQRVESSLGTLWDRESMGTEVSR